MRNIKSRRAYMKGCKNVKKVKEVLHTIIHMDRIKW